MDAKMTVERMVSALEGAAAVILDSMTPGAKRTARIEGLTAARDYILTAKSQIAEAMSVLSPSMPESGLIDACRQVKQAAISEAGNARKLESQIAERDAQIAEMRIELACRLGIIKQMRLMAFGARAEIATLIFGVEELAMSEEKRIALIGLTEANDGE